MTGIDWIIIGIVVLFAIWGWTQGLVVGLLSLAGFAGGAVLGTRLGPLLLEDGAESPYAPLFGLLGALVAGGILATGAETIGHLLRRFIPPWFRPVDGVFGALLTMCLALLICWVVGAALLQAPQARDLRRDLQRSFVLRQLNGALPPSGPLLNALARFDPFPAIDGPQADVAAPRPAIARDPQVRAARDGVVRVLGTACGLGISGSGWIARPGLVVTNAHVVAGVDDPEVQLRGEGDRLAAAAVAFDARNDLAVLRVDGLGGRALSLAPGNPGSGTSGAVLGFPGNGPYDVRPARLGSTSTVLTSDAYGRGPLQRSLTAFRGLVRSGNSGGPVVDGRGRVATTVFAATTGGRRGGYGVPNGIVRRTLARVGGTVGTGPCAR